MAIKNFKRASRFLIALFATLALCMPVAFATSGVIPKSVPSPVATASESNFISRWFQAAKESLSEAPRHVNSRGRLLLALSTVMGTGFGAYWLNEKYGFTKWVMSFFSEEKKSEGEGEGSWGWKKKATVGLLVVVLLVGITYFIRSRSSKEEEEEEEEATDPEIEK